MKTIFNFVISFLLIAGLISCSKKEDRLSKSASYASTVFVNNSILGLNVGVKYQNEPIAWSGGRVDVLSGLGKFTFYNKLTGAVLLEKEFDLQTKKVDTLYLFQPDATIAPQLIKNTQANESAAPTGYMKLKIANLSKMAFSNAAGMPYSKIDIVLLSTLVNTRTYVPYDTIRAIGSSLDTAGYYLIKMAVRAGLPQQNYRFTFLDHDTKDPILNSGSTGFMVFGFSALLTGRNVYTFYFADAEQIDADPGYIFKNGKYYDVSLNFLFE